LREIGGRGAGIAREQNSRLGTLESQVLGEGDAEAADRVFVEWRLIGTPSNTICTEKRFHFFLIESC
jgi:hypothetical protein